MPDEKTPKVVALNARRGGDPFPYEDSDDCVKLLEESLEMARETNVDRVVILMERSDGSVSRRWNGMPQQGLLWMLETAKEAMMREVFGDDDG